MPPPSSTAGVGPRKWKEEEIQELPLWTQQLKGKEKRGECIDFTAGATYIVGLIVGTCHSCLAAQEVENNGHPDSDPQRKAVSSLPALGRAVGAAQVRFYNLKLD